MDKKQTRAKSIELAVRGLEEKAKSMYYENYERELIRLTKRIKNYIDTGE